VPTIDLLLLALAGLALLSMPVFAVVSRRRPRDPEVVARPRTALLGYWVRDWLMWAVGPFERGLVRARWSPFTLNVAGLVCGVLAGAAYAASALTVAGCLVLAGGLADILDGRIARARGVTSARGAFLDSTLDRFTESLAFLGIVPYFRDRPLIAFAAALALAGSLLVSYARARGEAAGASVQGGMMPRAERLVLLGLASMLDGLVTRAIGARPGSLLAWGLIVIAVGSLGTSVWRTARIARIMRERRNPGS
jgi:CDP-diacylglycerol--glycerol-3-phosphate 3-phosphatidyltransferase